MEFKNKTILIISPESYGDVFLSKHHYAHELSKKNKVWFLNAKGNKSQKKILSINVVQTNLIVIDYNYYFYIFKRKSFFLTVILNFYLSKKIKRHIGKIDVVWSFEQAKFFNLKLFGGTYCIFHPVDYIPSFEKYKLNIARTSDVMFSVSNEILNEINVDTPKYLINHGLSDNNNNKKPSSQLAVDKSQINIAYVGNISYRYLDIENLKKEIEQNKDCRFHFIGPCSTSNIGIVRKRTNYLLLNSLPNVTFHGVINQFDLLRTLGKFDLFLVCYKHFENPIRISNSHKIIEYLSTGKTVISSYFPIYDHPDRQELLVMIKNNNDLGATISRVTQNMNFYNSETLVKKRTEYARANSYSNHLKEIELILSNYKENK